MVLEVIFVVFHMMFILVHLIKKKKKKANRLHGAPLLWACAQTLDDTEKMKLKKLCFFNDNINYK